MIGSYIVPLGLPLIEAGIQQTMTVGAILTEVGSGMTTILPDFSVIVMAAIVIGTVVFVGSVLYRRLRR